jgi:Na+-transporting methylmalonyl-CoA/oxaloacetate decarboxylase gamma subunit
MLESLKSASPFSQGVFVMIAGIGVVFFTLIVFFFLIKLLSFLYPDSQPLSKRLFGKKNV